MCRSPRRPREAQVERWSSRPQQARKGAQGGLELGVAVLRQADDLGIQAEGDVVDEGPPVHVPEVDRAFHRHAERVERADHVVAVEAEVHRQVVPGACGHNHHRHAVPGGHARDQRLGAVAARHAEHVGPTSHGSLCQVDQVLPWAEDDRLDAAGPAFSQQGGASGGTSAIGGARCSPVFIATRSGYNAVIDRRDRARISRPPSVRCAVPAAPSAGRTTASPQETPLTHS